jgi:hypothetical protein
MSHAVIWACIPNSQFFLWKTLLNESSMLKRRIDSVKNKRLIGFLFVSIAVLAMMMPLATAETLVKSDFEQESFAKTVDYYDYVRAYATLNGIQTPDNFDKWHANMYMTYVNISGLKLLYAGLDNITFGNEGYLRIPMQSFIMHYKTNENNRDVVLASTFLMLMAFNETATSRFANSPDLNDILYASFSLGFDLSAYGAVRPALNSKTEIIPLTHTDDKLTWSWGMRYTNLTALWWRTWIDPANPRFENSLPLAITTYDELTFTYTLTINPAAGTATLQENHVIGRMRELIVGLFPLLWTYYNNTGHYGPLGRKLSDETIYDYIRNNNLKMSIINFQTSVMADHETYSETPSGQNVTDSEVAVTDTSINTLADDGEKIFSADFGTKKNYKLYDYAADPTESTFATYESTARTAKIQGFAGNAGLFKYHIGLMKFLPLVVAHMFPALLAKSVSTIANMSRANYFYITAYPQYSGFRVEHDPVFTAYIATSEAPPTTSPGGAGGFVVIALVIVAVAVAAVVFALRRKPKSQATT